MNREEILAMEPGQELDALVVEKVMGWADFWKSQHHLMAYPPQEQNLGVGYDERHPVPEYSTDISAAWEVVEKLFKLGFIIEIHGLGDIWSVDVYNFKPEGRGKSVVLYIESLTAQESIVKAALIAVTEGKDEE